MTLVLSYINCHANSVTVLPLHDIISLYFFIFFFNDTATTEIYTLSLHDALPICTVFLGLAGPIDTDVVELALAGSRWEDRKSTRLNSSHVEISYAVFCLKKKKNSNNEQCIK